MNNSESGNHGVIEVGPGGAPWWGIRRPGRPCGDGRRWRESRRARPRAAGRPSPGPGRLPCDGSRPTRGRSLPRRGPAGRRAWPETGRRRRPGRRWRAFAIRLEELAEVDGQRGVVNRGGPAQLTRCPRGAASTALRLGAVASSVAWVLPSRIMPHCRSTATPTSHRITADAGSRPSCDRSEQRRSGERHRRGTPTSRWPAITRRNFLEKFNILFGFVTSIKSWLPQRQAVKLCGGPDHLVDVGRVEFKFAVPQLTVTAVLVKAPVV